MAGREIMHDYHSTHTGRRGRHGRLTLGWLALLVLLAAAIAAWAVVIAAYRVRAGVGPATSSPAAAAYRDATAVAKAAGCKVLTTEMRPTMISPPSPVLAKPTYSSDTASLVECREPVPGNQQQQMLARDVLITTYRSPADQQQSRSATQAEAESVGARWALVEGNGWVADCTDNTRACEQIEHKIGGKYELVGPG